MFSSLNLIYVESFIITTGIKNNYFYSVYVLLTLDATCNYDINTKLNVCIIEYFSVCTLLRIVYSLYFFLYVSVSHFLDINKPVDDKQLSSES